MRNANSLYQNDAHLFRKDILYFSVIAEVLNLSKAADVLGTSQPQLSKSLRDLEIVMNKQLFIRQSRGLELTAAGQNLRDRIKLARNAAQTMSDETGELRNLRLGFHEAVAMIVYSKLIHPLLTEIPDLNLNLEFATSHEVTRRVKEGQLDFGFVANIQKSPEMISHKILVDGTGIWKSLSCSTPNVLYFNPEMIDVQKVLRKYKNIRSQAITNYELIASTLAHQPDSIAVLPNSVAKRYGLKSFAAIKFAPVDIQIITHRQVISNARTREIFRKLAGLN